MRTRWRDLTKFGGSEQCFGHNGGVASGGATIDAQGFIGKKPRAFRPVERLRGVVGRVLTSKTQPTGWTVPDPTPAEAIAATATPNYSYWASDDKIIVNLDVAAGHTYDWDLYAADGVTLLDPGGGGGSGLSQVNIFQPPAGVLVGSTDYVFEVTTTRTDNGNTAVTSTPFTTPSFSTQSFSFDGSNEHLEVTVNQDIDLYGLSMWFNSNQTFGTTPHAGVLFGPGWLDWFLALGGNYTSALDNEIISIAKGERYGCDSYDDGSGTPATTISAGDWHHIAAAWSNTSATNSGNPGYDIYLDGNKVGNMFDNRPEAEVPTPSLDTLTSGQQFTIGIRQNISYPFAGKIDEVAIFSSTISEADVAAMHANGPGDLESFAPTGWWRMGEGATWDGVAGAWTIPDLGKIAGTTNPSNNHAVSVNMSAANVVTEAP